MNENPTVLNTIIDNRWLGNNEPISLKQAEREVSELGPDWRLETPHEAFSDIDYDHKNPHGAFSRNPNRQRSAYWTNRPSPADPAARVVVWFDDGSVCYYYDGYRAPARAVRVFGQSSAPLRYSTMKIQISVEVLPSSEPIFSVGQLVPLPHATETAIPQINFSSAPALEVRELGSGQRISQEQMLKELSALGGEWRLETRQELYALVDLTHKNQHGAYTPDPSLHPDPYWSADKHPADPAARVVVWFVDGIVSYVFDSNRARARAVRVFGQ